MKSMRNHVSDDTGRAFGYSPLNKHNGTLMQRAGVTRKLPESREWIARRERGGGAEEEEENGYPPVKSRQFHSLVIHFGTLAS